MDSCRRSETGLLRGLSRRAPCISLLFLLLAAAFAAPAAAAASSQAQAAHQRDQLRVPDGYVFPRKATFAQAALMPLPDRPKDLGNLKDKFGNRAENGRELAYAPAAAPTRSTTECAGHAHSWAWISRAPPTFPA